MISETEFMGPMWWKISWEGIRGGLIKIKVHRNRISFVKTFHFNENETFETAIKILRNKVTRILHYKNQKHTYLGMLAQYAIDATEIIETEEDFV